MQERRTIYADRLLGLREGLRALELDLRRVGGLSAASVLQNQINVNQSLTIAGFDRIIERVEQNRKPRI